MSRLSGQRDGMQGRETGMAALELSLFLLVLFALLALAAPLANLLLAKSHLERAAGQAVRHAVQIPSSVVTTDQPDVDAICSAATADYPGSGCSVTVCPGADSTAPDWTTCHSATGSPDANDDRPAGSWVRVQLTNHVDLSLFGAVLAAAGLHASGVNISASAVQRQE